MPNNNKQALVPADEIVNQVIELGNGFNIEVPDDLNEIKTRLIKAEVKSVLSAVEAGVYYAHLKSSLQHGQYMAFLKEIHVPQQRANDQIRVAKLFKKLNHRSNGDLKTSNFNLTQLIELTRLPEQQLEVLELPQLEAFSQMPVKQLRLAIKDICLEHDEENKIAAENAKLKKDNAELDRQRVEAINARIIEEQRKSPETLYGLPARLAEIKVDAPRLSEQLFKASIDIAHRVEDLCASTHDFELNKEIAVALGTLANAPFLHLLYALDKLKGVFGEEVIGNTNLPEFNRAQWEEAHARRRTVINDNEFEYGYASASQLKRAKRHLNKKGA